jgi:ABC-type sugar transport system ATPase subunit
LAAKIGQHVVLGLRPEHFHLRPTGSEADCCPLKVKLNVVEPLGNDMDVYMSTNLTDHVVGRIEATQQLQMGQEATVYVDLNKVHLFEPGATGMNLSLANEPAHAAA